MRPDRTWSSLPALLALAMLASAAPTAAAPANLSLCSGKDAPAPARRKACDTACHAGCERRKRA